MRPPVDYTPTGSRLVDFALNVIDGVELVFLLAAFFVLGRRPKDWGRVE